MVYKSLYFDMEMAGLHFTNSKSQFNNLNKKLFHNIPNFSE